MTTCPGYGVSCHTTLYDIKSDIQTQLNNNISLILCAAIEESTAFCRNFFSVKNNKKNFKNFLLISTYKFIVSGDAWCIRIWYCNTHAHAHTHTHTQLVTCYVKIEVWIFFFRGRKCKTRSLVKAADAMTEHWTAKEFVFTDTSNMWPMLRSSK